MLLKKNIPLSYVFGKIKLELILLTIYSIAVYFEHTQLGFSNFSIPLAIPGILGTIISLLLAFRSNQAYDRWWEARSLWGAIVNDSRSFARQVLTFIDTSDGNQEKLLIKERMIKRQIIWNYSLSCHLRKQDASQCLDKYISEEERNVVGNAMHIPLALMEQHGNDLRTLLRNKWINEFQQVAMDDTLTRFSNAMGACERIKNTVFPVTYSFYIHLVVLLFVLILPFGLIEHVGIFQIPLVVAISCSFFLIEKMAIHLQDPFENKPTDTPTTTISRKIEQDLKQMLAKDDKVEPAKELEGPEEPTFYIL
ncbi:bestrophin family protein [Mucilaginibacter sp. KACC 22063]|uniref:bestrophin family protein n=1 Tax=Mucilaginibacter sp. KACC 22063 TaxID=3025666 RepID=UPI0023650B1E|nr:bestrophin family ion channel [Mucilaginibacter sp. KACC 22063]WDF55907.1 bestrophin family ion channel [Mucilaginibacter sp. KACC 22063]